VTPKSGVLLLVCCISAIAAVGCVFELNSGTPELGYTTTEGILAAAIPSTIFLFFAAVKDTKKSLR
jgi:hypothetical protein